MTTKIDGRKSRCSYNTGLGLELSVNHVQQKMEGMVEKGLSHFRMCCQSADVPELTYRKKWPRRAESQEAIIGPGGSRLSDIMESEISHGPGNARLADAMEAATSLIVTLLIYMISLRSP